VRLRLHHQAQQRNEHGGEISVDKYELVERYEALGDEDDFLAARRLFERELTGQSSARWTAASTATCSNATGAARCGGRLISTSRR